MFSGVLEAWGKVHATETAVWPLHSPLLTLSGDNLSQNISYHSGCDLGNLGRVREPAKATEYCRQKCLASQNIPH